MSEPVTVHPCRSPKKKHRGYHATKCKVAGQSGFYQCGHRVYAVPAESSRRGCTMPWRRASPKITNERKATDRSRRRAENRALLFGHLWQPA